MSWYWYCVIYFICWLITSGICVKDINDNKDVAESIWAGLFWPIIMAVMAIWYLVSLVFIAKTKLAAKWKEKYL